MLPLFQESDNTVASLCLVDGYSDSNFKRRNEWKYLVRCFVSGWIITNICEKLLLVTLVRFGWYSHQAMATSLLYSCNITSVTIFIFLRLRHVNWWFWQVLPRHSKHQQFNFWKYNIKYTYMYAKDRRWNSLNAYPNNIRHYWSMLCRFYFSCSFPYDAIDF